MKRRPTRRDLLVVIGRLQDIAGRIASAASDRNPNRAAEIAHHCDRALNMCVAARSYDPIAESGPWSEAQDAEVYTHLRLS